MRNDPRIARLFNATLELLVDVIENGREATGPDGKPVIGDDGKPVRKAASHYDIEKAINMLKLTGYSSMPVEVPESDGARVTTAPLSTQERIRKALAEQHSVTVTINPIPVPRDAAALGIPELKDSADDAEL